MEIYLIRHTKLNVNDGTCYGQSDLALADSFAEEQKILKTKIPDFFDAVYTSPLKRCEQLAREIHANTLIKSQRLLELNFGDWEMKTWDEINQDDLHHWMSDFVHVATPHGESYMDLFSRATSLFQEICATHDQRIAIITSAGVIRSIISYVLGLPLEQSFCLVFDYGKVSLIEVTDQAKKVHYLNL